MVSPCFSFGASLDSSEVGVQILWKGETRGGYFQFSVSSWYETMKRRHNSVTKPADYRTSTTYNISLSGIKVTETAVVHKCIYTELYMTR